MCTLIIDSMTIVYQTLADYIRTFGQTMFDVVLLQFGNTYQMKACSFENQKDKMIIMYDNINPNEFVSLVFAPNCQMQIIGMQTEKTTHETINTFHTIITSYYNGAPPSPLHITIDVAHPQASFEYGGIVNILDKYGYSYVYYDPSAKICGSYYTTKCPDSTITIPAYVFTQYAIQSADSMDTSGTLTTLFGRIVVKPEMNVLLPAYTVSLMRGHVEDDHVEIYGWLKLDKPILANGQLYRPMRLYKLISGTADSVIIQNPMLAGFHTHPAEVLSSCNRPSILHPSSPDIIALISSSITQSVVLQYVATPDGIYRFSLTRLFTIYLGILIRGLAEQLTSIIAIMSKMVVNWESVFRAAYSSICSEMTEEFRKEEIDSFHEKWLPHWNTLTFNQMFDISQQRQYFERITQYISQKYTLDMTSYYDTPIFSFTFTHWSDIQDKALLDTINMPLYHGISAPLIY